MQWGILWGVDSTGMRPHHPVHYVSATRGPMQEMTAYEFVSMRATELTGIDTKPAFWGRYLNGASKDYNLIAPEIDYLLSRGCRIVPIFLPGSHNRNGFDAGSRAAEAAEGFARQIGVPDGVRIYADLENRAFDSEWFRGWCTRMFQSNYGGMGGVYGDTQHSWSWGAAAAAGVPDDPQSGTLISDLAAGRVTAGKSSLFYTWTTRPFLGHELTTGEPLMPSEFRAINPPANFLMKTVLWQYRQNVKLGLHLHHGALVDLDLATEDGYADMWS